MANGWMIIIKTGPKWYLELKHLNHVAYVRFASVYREFKDVSQFLDELKPILEGRGIEGMERDA